ncbi:unnamed protein product [Merluccius merluccius]
METIPCHRILPEAETGLSCCRPSGSPWRWTCIRTRHKRSDRRAAALCAPLGSADEPQEKGSHDRHTQSHSLEGRIEPSKKMSKSLTIPGSSVIVRKSLSHEPGDVGRIDLQTLVRLTGPRGDARLERRPRSCTSPVPFMEYL